MDVKLQPKQNKDPKGSGVIRPDDIPTAIGSACELLSTRIDTKKPFIVHASRAKVYPLHSLMDTDDGSEASMFINSNVVNMIKPSDHVFDMPERAKRLQKKQSGTINTYNSCSRAPTDTPT